MVEEKLARGDKKKSRELYTEYCERLFFEGNEVDCASMRFGILLNFDAIRGTEKPWCEAWCDPR
jgi:hypothetical protein